MDWIGNEPMEKVMEEYVLELEIMKLACQLTMARDSYADPIDLYLKLLAAVKEKKNG